MPAEEHIASRSTEREEAVLLYASYAFAGISVICSLILALPNYEKLSPASIAAFTIAEPITIFFGIATFLVSLHLILSSVRKELKRVRSDVNCEFIGDDEAAARYVWNVCRTDKSLEKIFDTCVRVGEAPQWFSDDTYKLMREGLQEFLGRDHSRIECVFGRVVDNKYAETLKAVFDGLGGDGDRRITGFELMNESPFMNFMVLQYEKYSEVLFGWGRRSGTVEREAVFLSRDERVVEEFLALHATMQRPEHARRLPHMTLRGKAATVQQVSEWSLDGVHEFLEKAEAGESINIWTTYFVDDATMYPLVRKLLKKGVDINILLMDPENRELLRSRFRQRRGSSPRVAEGRIRGQLEAFGVIAREYEQLSRNEEETQRKARPISGTSRNEACRVGSLKVKPCNTMPFGSFYQLGQREMIYGIFPPLESWEKGPLVHVFPGGDQWEVFAESWKEVWSPETDLPVDDDLSDGSAQDPERQHQFAFAPLHHYHLTLNGNGDSVWVYKQLKFGWERGKLVAYSPIVVDDSAKNLYQFTLSVHGNNVVLIAMRIDKADPDIGVEFLPRPGPFGPNLPPLFGARIITTHNQGPVTTISILASSELIKEARPGRLGPKDGASLERQWLDADPRIRRLPGPVPPLDIAGQWSYECHSETRSWGGTTDIAVRIEEIGLRLEFHGHRLWVQEGERRQEVSLAWSSDGGSFFSHRKICWHYRFDPPPGPPIEGFVIVRFNPAGAWRGAQHLSGTFVQFDPQIVDRLENQYDGISVGRIEMQQIRS